MKYHHVAPWLQHATTVVSAHTSAQDVRIYVVIGLLAFAVVGLVYEAAFKRQTHDLKLATGAALAIGVLFIPGFTAAMKIFIDAGIIACIVIYLMPHGLFRRQSGEVFVGLALVVAYAFLTAPEHYLLPYILGSVR
ncbi:MAG: hypothetical protein KGI41_01195 [Patescibacteria group bacterium]|nr:hypothetical protein [Patescibacteria group bacterium]MDE1965842.1 hypothetical protein [Patescibacteria group bacterium]